VDSTDDGAPTLSQGPHQRNHLEAGGTVQTAVATQDGVEEKETAEREGESSEGEKYILKVPPLASPCGHPPLRLMEKSIPLQSQPCHASDL